MAYPTYSEHEAPRITPAVQWLIAINVAIYFLQLTLVGPEHMQQFLGFKLADLPGSLWTVATYMFVHGSFWHVTLNMYTLWVFGPRVEHEMGSTAFTRFYLWCGLGGWLFHLLLGPTALLIGASAAVFGVMLAYAMRWPDDELMLFGVIPMRVKWFVAMLVVGNLVQGIGLSIPTLTGESGGPGIAYLAHLGGFAFAWLYLRTPSSQSLDRLKQRIAQVPDVTDETPRAIPRSLPRTRDRERESEVDDIVAKSKAVMTKRPQAPTVPGRAPVKPSALDEVLDKISRTGIESLTGDEKRLLDEASRKLRDS
jgi:membrane associated rhomboid family serine protease